MRKFSITAIAVVIIQMTIAAGSFPVDPQIPATPLNDQTVLTVLNSRLGSRFTLSPVFRDNGIHTGALGYDEDEFSELLIGIETATGNYCFRTCSPPRGYKYLKNQQMIPGLTCIVLTGETDDGSKVTAQIVSPFTPSASLSDTVNIKVQISPAFYLITSVSSSKPVRGKIRTGIKKLLTMPDNLLGAKFWMYESSTDVAYFRDNSSVDNKLVLAGLRNGHKHFWISGFNGLEKEFTSAGKNIFSDTLIYATHYAGQVMYDNKYNLALQFYYTRYWKSLKDVLQYARQNAVINLDRSGKFENLLTRSKILPEEKWLVSLSFRSDMANAFFLTDAKHQPRFYLAEGRFRHLSTVDVAYETELMALFAPWRLQLQLDQWSDYVARKEVDRGTNSYGKPHKEGMTASEYGPFIYHDVGDQPFLSITSDYWFGPHMAVEENCNFTLLLYWYWKLTGDDAYTKTHLGMVDILLYSVMNRDTDGSGIADKGMGWSTFDNADVLKRSPENVFIGVKQMTAYLAAAEMFAVLANKNKSEQELIDIKNAQDGKDMGYETGCINNESLRLRQHAKYTAEAQKIAHLLNTAFKRYGYIPCSLDTTFPGWDQQSVTLCDGLWFTALADMKSDVLQSVIPALAETYKKALKISTAPYGIKISSGEGGTWFSKIMVTDVIGSYYFGVNNSSAGYAYRWNKNHYYCYNDGIKSDGATSWIGYWYPRGVSSFGYLLRENKFTAGRRNEFLNFIR